MLVETGGKARSKVAANVTAAALRTALEETVDKSAQIVTDDHSCYPLAAANFEGGHQTVNHSEKEYARKRISDDGSRVETITTNTAEAYFSILKRGVYGTFHHVSKQHLHRYCAEFDFRWNGWEIEDAERRDLAVKGAEGKRLFYKKPISSAMEVP